MLIFLTLGQGVRPSYNRVPDDQSGGGGQPGAGQPDSGDMDNLQAGDEIRKNNNNSCIKFLINLVRIMVIIIYIYICSGNYPCLFPQGNWAEE